MQSTKMVELIVGIFVALGLAAFFMLAIQVSDIAGDLNPADSYTVTARFQNIGGLKVLSPITLAGVRIGRVSGIELDEQTFEATVRLAIERRYDRLPTDSSASILTAGLLGEQYVSLEPGGMEDSLKEGDRIQLTQSALVLEQLVGRLLTGSGSSGDKPKE